MDSGLRLDASEFHTSVQENLSLMIEQGKY